MSNKTVFTIFFWMCVPVIIPLMLIFWAFSTKK